MPEKTKNCVEGRWGQALTYFDYTFEKSSPAHNCGLWLVAYPEF